MDFIDLKTQQLRIKDKIDRCIQQVLGHGKYIMGPEIFELERKLAEFVGVRHCITTASGTDSLLMAEMALGLERGDEVITTPLTWISTIETLALLGVKPVFVDIDSTTFHIDPAKIEAAITEKTKAIIPVSLYGQCSDMTQIQKIADCYGLVVIEDGAQSFGATHSGRYSGNLSLIGTTSFFPAKPLGCYGDGGACFTNDEELAEKMRWIRVHGQKEGHDVRCVGINGRLDTLQAAILLEKLLIYPDEIKLRNQVAEKYNSGLASVVGVPKVSSENTSVYALYTICTGRRDQLQKYLMDKDIPTGIYYPNLLHLVPAYGYLGYSEGEFPCAEKAVKEILSLPMHPYLTTGQQDHVIDCVASALVGKGIC